MALIASVLGLGDQIGNSTTLAASTSTGAIAITKGRQIAINATQDMCIRFTASASVSAATATDFRIPQNQTFVFSVPAEITTMYLFNPSASTLTYYWTYLSKF